MGNCLIFQERGFNFSATRGVSGATTMKPYPLVSDLWEPVPRVAMPRAPRMVVGQELASCSRRIKDLSPK